MIASEVDKLNHSRVSNNLLCFMSLRFKHGSVYMQRRVIRRMKYLAGYPGHTAKKIKKDDLGFVLTEVDKYGMGTERTLEEFIKFSQIEIDDKGNLVCTKRLDWCMDQTLH